MSVASVPLGEVASFVRGITYKPADIVPNFSDGAVVCMRTANVQALLDDADVLSIPRRLVRDERKILREGDLLVSTANSWNLVGKCCWVPALSYEATVGGFIAALRGDPDKVDPRYLYRWFSSPNAQANARNCGRQTTNISNMDLGRCLALELPLPALPEQRRIAAILDKADALRAKRRHAIAKLDQLLQSVFLDMFGDPEANSKGWSTASLGAIAKEKMSNGIFKKKDEYSVSGMPVVWVEELFRGHKLDLSASRMFSPSNKEIENYGLLPGDILFCRSSLKLDGIAYNNVYLGPEKGALFECHLIRLRVKEHLVDPLFLNYLLRFEGVRKRIKQRAKTATMTTIDQGGLGSIEVIVPPLDLQKRFRFFLERLLEKADVQRQQAAALEALLKSLQQRAFFGAL